MKKVLTHGVFDLLHNGHLAYLNSAKKFGDYLIVSITTDRFVNKGPGRPHFNHHQRADMLRALSVVDEVVISDSPTAVSVINDIKPDFYVKGPDYKDLKKDVTGEIYNEISAVEAYGGKVVFTDDDTQSSSNIINKFFQGWNEEQKEQIEKIKSLGGIKRIEAEIEKLKSLNVVVFGEPIIDIYRFVTAEGISSKSPTVSCRYNSEEKYRGGAWAIKNHLSDFVNIKFSGLYPDIPKRIPTKIRYIQESSGQKIFEVTRLDESWWNLPRLSRAIDSALKKCDLGIIADFGHGMIEGPVLDALANTKTFLALNVQTNSSNFGYNVYTKHKKWDYLCIDTREARLAEHDRFSDPLAITERIFKKHHGLPVSVTLGSNGSILYAKETNKCPAFSDVIIDATGAGDAYFGITSVLLRSGCDETLIPFIGNVFAGLKAKIIGNKSAVSKASLLKACTGILK